MNNISGIYGIRSISHPERVYIGSAVNFMRRRGKHFKALENGNHHSAILQSHYNKYGGSDLVFEIILYCDDVILIEMEQAFLDLFNPWFNICPIAGNPMEGRTHSEEAKERIASAQRGKFMSEETRAKIGASRRGNTDWRGRHHSEESKAKISAAITGIIRSEETRKKISEAKKNPSEETREKLRRAASGKSPSKETRAKMSSAQMGNKSNLGRHLPLEQRENISKANRGKRRSEEFREKMREIGKCRPPMSEESKARRRATFARKRTDKSANRALKK